LSHEDIGLFTVQTAAASCQSTDMTVSTAGNQWDMNSGCVPSPLATSSAAVWILWNPLLIQCWLEAILKVQEIWARKILRKYKPLVYCKDREVLSGVYQG